MIERITILFSLSMSIKKWQAMGIFEKEMVIFSEYLRHGVAKKVSLFTYDSDDVVLLDQAKENGLIDQCIDVIPAPRIARNKLGAIIYSLLGPLLQRQHFNMTTAVYSHQSSGAWTGLISKFIYGHRFVYRYGHSLWRRHLDRRQYHRLMLSWPLDQLLTRCSDYALVSTKRDQIASGRVQGISVCPNFIDTGRLPIVTHRQWLNRESRAVYVGRLVHFKNLHNLIEACAHKNLPLDIYGSGPLEQSLKEHARALGGDCQFKGLVNNITVRQALPRYRFFFLVSTYEGMPKSLLEGMASGCLCVVSPHYGCTEIIDHAYNGLVCDNYSVGAISQAIDLARGSDGFAFAAQGQQDVLTRYSLDYVVSVHRAAYIGSEPQLDVTGA